MPLRGVVVLMTTSPRDIIQETAQRRVLDILAGKQIDVEVVDGRLHKERREETGPPRRPRRDEGLTVAHSISSYLDDDGIQEGDDDKA